MRGKDRTLMALPLLGLTVACGGSLNRAPAFYQDSPREQVRTLLQDSTEDDRCDELRDSLKDIFMEAGAHEDHIEEDALVLPSGVRLRIGRWVEPEDSAVINPTSYVDIGLVVRIDDGQPGNAGNELIPVECTP